jgi:superfamily II DNA or RNA helicase
MISFSLEKNTQTVSLISDKFLSLIRERFSIVNPAFGRGRFANQFTPRRLYAITASGKFDIGIYGEIINFCREENIPFTENKDVTSFYAPAFREYNIQPLNLQLREYQRESVTELLKNGRGVVVLPTGAGKTLTIATLINTILFYNKPYKVLIIVPTIQLIRQTYSDFVEYGIDSNLISKWSGDDAPNFDCNIVIAGSQILQSQSKNIKSYLNSINILVVDECHKLRKKNEINNILKEINTCNKFGFTGTMPSDLLDQWNIKGKLGPILYQKESITLRDDKQIANIYIQILLFNYINKPSLSSPNSFSPTKAFDEEIEFLINSSQRNKKIAAICSNTDKNTLVVCERISHGEALYSTLKQTCSTKQIYFIQGSVDVSTREEIRSLMEREHNIVCIAISKIFAEGINIKNLHYIVFAASGKAKIKILQTIGRGVRLHPLKNMLYIFDIADNLRYSNKHLKERIKLYETEKIHYKTTEIQI